MANATSLNTLTLSKTKWNDDPSNFCIFAMISGTEVDGSELRRRMYQLGLDNAERLSFESLSRMYRSIVNFDTSRDTEEDEIEIVLLSGYLGYAGVEWQD